MKAILFVLILGTSFCHADITSTLYSLYKNGQYEEACNSGRSFFSKMQQDEKYLSIYAFSCLKSDQIDRLNGPAMALNQTAEARSNASYFAMLVLQKKMLLQSLYDGKIFNAKHFPTSSHLLSKLFKLYSQNPQNENVIKSYTDPINTRLSYKLYTTESTGRKTIAIDEYYDNILSVHHVYN